MRRIVPLVWLLFGCVPGCTPSRVGGEPPGGDSSIGDPSGGDGAGAGDTTLGARMASPCGFPPPETAYPFQVSSPIVTGLNQPVFITHAPADPAGERLFVAEKGGQIVAFPKGDPATQTTYLQNIPGLAATGDLGLVSVAFHPDFATNGHLYVYLARSSPLRSVVSRFTASPPSAATVDPTTEQTVFEVRQPAGNHNGGTLAFGADGYLYVAFGDGGPQEDPDEHSQNSRNLHGTMVRIDVDGASPYAIPTGNLYPTAGGAVACGILEPTGSPPTCSMDANYTCTESCAEIWAGGFRSPWKWSFDSLTGELWMGDVGQNAWEEINLVKAGLNYGWDCREGFGVYADPQPSDPLLQAPCDGPFEDPIVAYPNPGLGRSVVGGYIYRGSNLPELQGAYLYGDTYQDAIWALRYDGATIVSNEIVAESSISTLVSFGEDAAGEIYLVYYSGSIARLERAPAGTPATFPATLTATGCYTDVPNRIAGAGIIPYDVSAPLWSDGTLKRRYMALPDAVVTVGLPSSAAASDEASNTTWVLPNDTVLIKEFSRMFAGTEVPLETRFLIIRSSGAVDGYSYKWRDDQTDADLLPASDTQCYDVSGAFASSGCEYTHVFPSRSECRFCHNAAAGGALGVRTAQLNRDYDYGGIVRNQLLEMERIGLFSTALPDLPNNLLQLPTYNGTAALQDRARSYLDANCAMCHRPGGPMASMDLRFTTPLSTTGTCGVSPVRGDLGVSGALLLDPGSAATSIVYLRMNRRDPDQMPPLASTLIDPQGVALVQDWINALSSCP